MADIKFYGASDDLIEIEGDVGGGLDEINAEKATFVLDGLNVRVHAWYTNRGLWAFGVSKSNEDEVFPNDVTIWYKRCEYKDQHSVQLNINHAGAKTITVVREHE